MSEKEFEVIMSPLLSNKIDEKFKELSSNLEKINKTIKVLSYKIDTLENSVSKLNKNVQNNEIQSHWKTSV